MTIYDLSTKRQNLCLSNTDDLTVNFPQYKSGPHYAGTYVYGRVLKYKNSLLYHIIIGYNTLRLRTWSVWFDLRFFVFSHFYRLF